MALRKRFWIPLSGLGLIGALFVAAWFYVPEYAERRFTEKLRQVGIETDSVEFRIEGFSRPVVRDLSLRISGVNLVAESIEFGSLFDGYGEDKPLKITVNGLWAGVNAQIPEGLMSVNNAIIALPEKKPFQAPLPMEITFQDGVVLYENRDRQIQGIIDGKLFVETTVVDWELAVDVRKHPVEGRGSFDWNTGDIHVSGELDLSHELSQAIWDIMNEEPYFDWNAGRLQTAFHFEGENFKYQNGHIHLVTSEVGIAFNSLDLSAIDHVASIIWTPGHTTVDCTGSGSLSRLLETPFSWEGSFSVEPGPNLQFELTQALISPAWPFGSIQLSQPASNTMPLEVSLLAESGGYDFQVLGLDLLLGSEWGDQLVSSTLDLMVNGRWENNQLLNSSADLWFRDGLLMAPVFQAEIGEGLLNAVLNETSLSSELFASIVANPSQFIQSASFSAATLYRYVDVVGENITLDWTPGHSTPVTVQGRFMGIGAADLSISPDGPSTLRQSAGTLRLNPGNFSMDYQFEQDPARGAEARVELTDYPIEEYPNLENWLTGEFDITGLISAQANIKVTPESLSPKLEFQLENVLYASGNLVMDNANYAGIVNSFEPFHLTTSKPFTASMIQVNGWPVSDFHTELEIGNRINIVNTSFAAMGGMLKFADISMGLDDWYIESEIGVSNIQTDQVLQVIPKVIGMAEGSISGVIPFQWDMKNSKFALGRGHLYSPEGEEGFMNLKIFRPEGDLSDGLGDERYSMVDEALSNLQNSSLDIDIIPPNELTDDTRVRLNIKGFVDSRLVKAPVDVVRYYSLPIDTLTLTMEQVRQDLPGLRSVVD